MEIKKYREKAGLSQTELGQRIGVSINSVLRWEKNYREPRASDIRKLCEALNVTESELLNGPSQEEFKVTLKYVKTLDGVDEEMNMNGISLTIADDGFVGVSGGKKFESYEDIDEVMQEIRHKLTFGFKHRDEVKATQN